jgi:hypothetical protein
MWFSLRFFSNGDISVKMAVVPQEELQLNHNRAKKLK